MVETAGSIPVGERIDDIAVPPISDSMLLYPNLVEDAGSDPVRSRFESGQEYDVQWRRWQRSTLIR